MEKTFYTLKKTARLAGLLYLLLIKPGEFSIMLWLLIKGVKNDMSITGKQ